MKRNLHNLILIMITIVAVAMFIGSFFTMCTWPNKSFAALVVASVWIMAFIEINSNILFKED